MRQRLQQVFPVEECKVAPHFFHVELARIGFQWGPDAVKFVSDTHCPGKRLKLDPNLRGDDGKERPSSRGPALHVPSVFPAHVVQRMADLAERVGFHGFHQGGEDVGAVAGGFLEVGEAGGRARG